MEVEGYPIYYMDPEEQMNAFLQAVEDHGGGKVAFVTHPRSGIFLSGVNLELIYNAGETYTTEIIFIISHEQSRRLLEEAGFSVYENMAALEKGKEKSSSAVENDEGEECVKKEQVDKGSTVLPRSLYRMVIILSIFLFLCTAGRWLVLHIPSTTVEVRPVLEEVKCRIVIQACVKQEQPDLDMGIIPLHTFSLQENLEKDFPVRGTKKKGVEAARGSVLFINEGDTPFTIPQGTVLATEGGATFKTSFDLEVPAQKVETMHDLPLRVESGWGEVEIRAAFLGTGGNVPSGSINTILHEDYPVSVVNPEATWGGEDALLQIVTRDDLQWVQEQMKQFLKDECIRTAYRQLSDQYWIIEEGMEIRDVEISSAQAIEEETCTIEAWGSMDVQGFMVGHQVLNQALAHGLSLEVPSQEIHWASSFQRQLESISLEEERVVLEFSLHYSLAAAVDVQGIRELVAGLAPEEARERLSAREDIRSFRILTPEDSRIPGFTPGIRVVIMSPL